MIRPQHAIPILILLLVGIGWPAVAQPPGVLNFWNASSGNWTTATNWSRGTVPDGQDVTGDDFAIIGGLGGVNGTDGISVGAATVNSSVTPMPGGIVLGLAAANSGSLTVSSGGTLTVADTDFDGDGSVLVGSAGTGNLHVDRGGTLNAVTLTSGGNANSAITLGGGGAGTATVSVSGAATFGRTTRVVGPNVAFSAGSIAFQSASVFIPEITGATHSALKTSGNAGLGGTLQVVFNGVTPTTSSTWNLIDAATISGAFTSIVPDPSSPLGLGQVLGVRTVNGGNGQLGQLFVQQQPVLSINRNTGAVAITNPGSAGIDLDGYTIQSTNGALVQGNWQSLATHPAVAGAGWSEANPTANRLSELRSSGNSTLGGTASWGLGNIFHEPTPAQFGQNLEDVVFQYDDPVAQKTVTGVVNYTGGTGINNLVLFADPATGNVKIRNTSPFTVAIDGYTIASTAGSLNSNPALWTSLQDQPGAAGATWAEANLSDNRVSELKSSGTTTLNMNGGTTFDLGGLFKTAGAKDLVFQFLLSGNSTPNTGAVVYEAAPSVGGVLGDYNKNGVVDAADYTVWRDKLGQPAGSLENRNPANSGPIGADDYTFWKSRFGATSGSGGGSLAGGSAVPEPTTAALLLATSIIVGLVARRRIEAV